jgi:hypothetical protein
VTGFITMQRAVFDHPLFQGDSSRLGAWLWLVGKACWKPTPFNIQGKTITLDRGQLCVSIRSLASEWGWSKSAVDRFITRLKTETMIEAEAGHGRLVITICNYSKYQDREESQRDTGGTQTGTAAGQQRDIKEQGNKGTRLKRESNDSHVGDDEKIAGQMQQIVEVWNAVALPLALPRCHLLSDKRKAALRARLKQYGFDDIKRAMLTVPRSSFLRGDSGDWKGASFDFFILQPDSVLRTLEGKYDDRHKPARDTRDGFLRAVDAELGIG